MTPPEAAAYFRAAQTALARDRRRLAWAAAILGTGLIAAGWWWPAARVELMAGGAALALFGCIHGFVESRRRPRLLLGRLVKKELRPNISVGNSVTMKGKPFLEPWLEIEAHRYLALAPGGGAVDLPLPAPIVQVCVYDGVYDRIREGEEFAFLYSPSDTFLGFFDGGEFVGD